MTRSERQLLMTLAECVALLVYPISREWSKALKVAIDAVQREGEGGQ